MSRPFSQTLLLSALALCATSCSRSKRPIEVEGKLHEIEKMAWVQQIELAEDRLILRKKMLANQNAVFARLESGAKRVEDLGARRDLLASKINTLKSDITQLKTDWSEFLALARQESIGRTFDALKTISGKVYLEARVLSVRDDGVLIRHRDGLVRLGMDDLSPTLARELGLDPERYDTAMLHRRRAEVAYHSYLDKQSAQSSKLSPAPPTKTSGVPRIFESPQRRSATPVRRRSGLERPRNPVIIRRYNGPAYRWRSGRYIYPVPPAQ